MRKIILLAAAGLIALTSPKAFAEESCSGSGTPLTKAAIEAKLKAEGYVKIKELVEHDGCYEAKGYDKDGKRFEVEVNGYTGAIAKSE
jgi:hypothetical protein